MKILFIAPHFTPALGGAENYVLNIALGLKRLYNDDVVVITTNVKKSSPDQGRLLIEECCGIKVYRLPVMLQILNTPVNPFWYGTLKHIIRTEKPDIINSHQPVPFIGDVAALLAGKTPFVLTYHSGTMRKDRLLPDIITFLYEKLVLPRTAKRATRIICASNFIKDTILQKHTGKSITVHPGADMDLFKFNPIVEREENLVLFVCSRRNMYKLKGLYFLIEALKSLPQTRLRIIGEKDDFADRRVVSAGVKRGKELVEEMQKASVVVLPSLAREGFPMVLVEAMACQTPVVGTDQGGIPEVIRDGIDGFVVPAKDSKALALAISKILADKELANRMGNSGETRVRKMLTWDSRIALTKEVFVSCLK